MVGTSGRSNQRSEPVTASARTSPFRISGCAPGSDAQASGTVPARIACTAGPAPANGTCVMLDAGDGFQPFAGQMRRGADAGAGIVERVRLGLGPRHQFRHRGDAGGGGGDEHVGRGHEFGDRGEILYRVVGHLLVEPGLRTKALDVSSSV